MVKMSGNDFRAEAMFDGLERASSQQDSITGFVRRDESEPKTVQFSSRGREQRWHPIPEKMISGFDLLRHSSALDGDHHLVRLYLRDRDDNAEGSEAVESAKADLAPAGSPTGGQYCYYDIHGNYICVPI